MPATQKHTIEGVLFDWDGTLIDSYHADTSAYLAMFKEMGIAWGLEELEKNYSPNWYQVYRAAGLPRKHWDEADRAWRGHYAKHRPKLIAGARRVLAKLRDGHHLGLVTSGDRDRVARQLRNFRLTRLFAAGVLNWLDRRTAGCFKKVVAPMNGFVGGPAYGFEEVAGVAAAAAGGTLGRGLKSAHLITSRTGTSSPF